MRKDDAVLRRMRHENRVRYVLKVSMYCIGTLFCGLVMLLLSLLCNKWGMVDLYVVSRFAWFTILYLFGCMVLFLLAVVVRWWLE